MIKDGAHGYVEKKPRRRASSTKRRQRASPRRDRAPHAAKKKNALLRLLKPRRNLTLFQPRPSKNTKNLRQCYPTTAGFEPAIFPSTLRRTGGRRETTPRRARRRGGAAGGLASRLIDARFARGRRGTTYPLVHAASAFLESKGAKFKAIKRSKRKPLKKTAAAGGPPNPTAPAIAPVPPSERRDGTSGGASGPLLRDRGKQSARSPNPKISPRLGSPPSTGTNNRRLRPEEQLHPKKPAKPKAKSRARQS